VEPKQRGAREDALEPLAKDELNRPDAQRADGQLHHGAGRERLLEVGRLAPLHPPTGEQEEDGVAQAPGRERESAPRRAVEPLDVVDRNEDGRLPGEDLEAVPDGDAQSARIDVRLRVVEEERRLERLAPGRGEHGDDVSEGMLEQVAESREGEPRLGLGRTRDQHAIPTRACQRDPRQPEGRLSDPRLALEHEGVRALHVALHEVAERRELRLPSHDPARHMGNDCADGRPGQERG